MCAFVLVPAKAQGSPEAAGEAREGSLASVKRHALSLVGKPKFGAHFSHFDWVKPDAPKGGHVRMWALGSFDTLNPFAISGDKANGLTLVYDRLMAGSLDEPSTEYCLVCAWVSYPPDYSSVTFGLRKEARFHDGRPVTADDVIFSFHALQKAHPFFRSYYKNVVKVERASDHEVTFRFNTKGNRELPQIMGQLYILPKHFWEAQGRGGGKRDLSKSTLEVPLGSGPYRIRSLVATREIVYERIKDWWAKDLPVMRGQWNFDELKFTYFRDKTPAFEAFKIGAIDYWQESSATWWATRFNFASVKRGLVRQEVIPLKQVAGMQAFVMNTRRAKFADPRVRRAIGLALNFEWANRTIFFNQYQRLDSYFDNSELASRGLAEGKELEILESVKEHLPPEVFGGPWEPPYNRTRADLRRHLGKASKLLDEAGWRLDGSSQDEGCGLWCSLLTKVGLASDGGARRVRRNSLGEALRIEFLLIYSGGFERIVLPFIRNLELLGIEASVRSIDTAQYQRRVQNFDFDIVTGRFSQSNSPGNEQRDFFGSGSADQPGSRNLAGIKNPAVDKIIQRIVFAKDRAELVAATRALDRTLLWNFYVVPQWYLPADRIAYWRKFDRPEKLPSQDPGFLRTWWFDKAAAAGIEAQLKR